MARRLAPQVEPGQILRTELAVTILYRRGRRPDAYVRALRITPAGTTGYDGHPPPDHERGMP